MNKELKASSSLGRKYYRRNCYARHLIIKVDDSQFYTSHRRNIFMLCRSICQKTVKSLSTIFASIAYIAESASICHSLVGLHKCQH